MASYKCKKCGLVNDVTKTECRRCGSVYSNMDLVNEQNTNYDSNSTNRNDLPEEANGIKWLPTTISIFVIIGLLGIVLYLFNYTELQSKMTTIINSDPRNQETPNISKKESEELQLKANSIQDPGIVVSVHFLGYFDTSALVYDLQNVSSSKSMADVFRVFLQFAEKVKDKNFQEVHLAFRGKTKFKISGNYFQNLGKEYSTQNPIYTVRTFPQNLKKLDGSKAYQEWSGGLLIVTQKQMEDFGDFHKQWYLNDLLIVK